jgi:hypothetical protein
MDSIDIKLFVNNIELLFKSSLDELLALTFEMYYLKYLTIDMTLIMMAF